MMAPYARFHSNKLRRVTLYPEELRTHPMRGIDRQHRKQINGEYNSSQTHE
jgi:hypothetical protein